MNWKMLAITFIILFTLQTIIFGSLLYIGNKVIIAESNCEMNCWEDTNCGSYYFEDYTETCYILDWDGEVIDTIKGW